MTTYLQQVHCNSNKIMSEHFFKPCYLKWMNTFSFDLFWDLIIDVTKQVFASLFVLNLQDWSKNVCCKSGFILKIAEGNSKNHTKKCLYYKSLNQKNALAINTEVIIHSWEFSDWMWTFVCGIKMFKIEFYKCFC